MILLEKFSRDLTAQKVKPRSLIKRSHARLPFTILMNSSGTFPFENERINSSGYFIAHILVASRRS